MEISSNGSHPHDTDDDGHHQYHHDHTHYDDQNQTPDDENETHHTYPIVEKFERLNFDDDKDVKFHNYPLRPYATDCSFYIRTGSCKFGENCRFNHPLERGVQVNFVDGDKEKTGFDSNGSGPGLAKVDCKYFSTPGGCKYGDSCRFNHTTGKIGVQGVELNFVGLPIRPWEKECEFYMRNGTCKYGANCRYHHPDPTSTKEFDRNSLTNGGSWRGDGGLHRTYQPPRSSGPFQGSQKANGMNLRNSVPYAANVSSYHQGVLRNPGWIQNQVPVPLPANIGPLPHQMMNNFSKTLDPLTHYEPGVQSDEFPVRPGQPDCDYFMKTGDCKYRSACRYNHPLSRTPNMQLPSVSMKGSYPRPATALPVQPTELPSLKPNYARKNGVPYNQQIQNGEFPERPGQPECEFFMKTGNCKFRSACRYHHPKNRVSTSSPITLNDKGLPLRPGSRICRNYEQLGTCKYGKNCLFDHPDDSYSAGQVAPVAAPQDNTVTDAQVTATNSELPRSSNDAPDWNDGWAI